MEHAEAKCRRSDFRRRCAMQSAWSTLRQRWAWPFADTVGEDAIRMEHAEAKSTSSFAQHFSASMQSAWSTLRQSGGSATACATIRKMQSAWSTLRQRPSRDTTPPLPGNATRMQRGGSKSPPILIFTFSFNEHRNQKQLPRKPNKIKGFRGSFEPRLAGFEPTIFRVGVEHSIH